jgi:uncharacterized protein YbbC (DUF1343 family)
MLAVACLAFIVTRAQPLEVREYSTVVTGALQLRSLLPMLKGKRVGIITNQTGICDRRSIVDTLLSLKVKIKAVLTPEHGFRGETDAGESVVSGTDAKTGLPLVSLYGNNKKPTAEQLKHIDVLIYDVQDLGVRFYTYISTMCYCMEACAENKKSFVVLDRPNPNGFYIDGPVLEKEWISFLGLHPVPIVYAMTCGEYAQMANGEGWLKNGVKCDLKVVPLKNYDRKSFYRIPVRPSPNIPNDTAAQLYPSLGLFEGTIMSLGRGTPTPFQVIGHPKWPDTSFCFVPRPTAVSKSPKFADQRCYGLDLRQSEFIRQHPRRLDIRLLKSIYEKMRAPDFFDRNFNFHAGNATLQEQVKNAVPEDVIRKGWEDELARYRMIRAKYLLYPDF